MKQLPIYKFGEKLLETMDLDPVYVLLYHAELDTIPLRKWLVAYWCFYHMGTASWITDQPNYWDAFAEAAASKEYPRCSERRHFRGDNAKKSVEFLRHETLPDIWDGLKGDEITLEKQMQYVRKWVGFGPWIAFKVCDMLERLKLRKVTFDDGAMFLFASPKEAATMLYEIEAPDDVPPSKAQQWAVDRLLLHFRKELAPPGFERKVNVQEVETILCKWKSYMNGHYNIGEDIESCQKSLEWYPTKTSKLLLATGKGVLWE